MEIKVLGQGCVQCDRLEKDLMEVMAEIDLAADLEHVREIKEIGKTVEGRFLEMIEF